MNIRLQGPDSKGKYALIGEYMVNGIMPTSRVFATGLSRKKAMELGAKWQKEMN